MKLHPKETFGLFWVPFFFNLFQFLRGLTWQPSVFMRTCFT